jgi:hypothetical protein
MPRSLKQKATIGIISTFRLISPEPLFTGFARCHYGWRIAASGLYFSTNPEFGGRDRITWMKILRGAQGYDEALM